MSSAQNDDGEDNNSNNNTRRMTKKPSNDLLQEGKTENADCVGAAVSRPLAEVPGAQARSAKHDDEKRNITGRRETRRDDDGDEKCHTHDDAERDNAKVQVDTR
jgi:hypothetical protein